MTTTNHPYPFQHEGAEWLAANPRAYLGDEMGLGKTVQAILAAQISVPRPETVLIVCPATGVPHWAEKLREWGGIPGAQIRILSYAKAINHNLGKMDLLIADEAHYLKTPSSKRTRKVLSAAKGAGKAWLMSGTPMPNGPHEVWAPVRALWPQHALGMTRKTQWVDKFCVTEETLWGVKIHPGIRNEEEFRGILGKFMVRRKHGDVGLNLPELRVDTVWFPKDPEIDRVLEEYEPDNVDGVLYQSTVRRLLGGVKAPHIANIVLEEMNDGAYASLVLLYHHRTVGSLLKDRLSTGGLRVVGFDGSSTGVQRTKAVEEFQAGKADVFLAQQVAAGEVITLTRSHEVILAEPDWVPDVNLQAIKRVHRIGQDVPCRARIFGMDETLDKHLMNTIHAKIRAKIKAGLN